MKIEDCVGKESTGCLAKKPKYVFCLKVRYTSKLFTTFQVKNPNLCSRFYFLKVLFYVLVLAKC
jgi:hypothetical protein